MERRRGSKISPTPWLRATTAASIFLLLLICGNAEPANSGGGGDEVKYNYSGAAAAGLFWSSAKEEAELLADSRDDSASSAVFGDGDGDNLDGGFSTLEGMLQWAIGHSDPAKLREAAQDVRRFSHEELENRRVEMKELMEKLKTPSDAQLMKTAIDDLSNSSVSIEDRYRALQELLILVEPIDNANDLHKLGGVVAVINQLGHPNSDIRRTSAWVLGKASQNNPAVQKQVLELGALAKLLEMLKSSFVEESIKALYAVSALIRNNLDGQKLFYAEAGDAVLQGILSNSSVDIRLCRKAVSLVADLAESQLETSHEAEWPMFSNHFFLKSVVDLTASIDVDLQEKALAAIKILLQLRSTEALVLDDFCGLEGALGRMERQFHNLMAQEEERSYAIDLENLRREVELMCHKKLEKTMKVPT